MASLDYRVPRGLGFLAALAALAGIPAHAEPSSPGVPRMPPTTASANRVRVTGLRIKPPALKPAEMVARSVAGGPSTVGVSPTHPAVTWEVEITNPTSVPQNVRPILERVLRDPTDRPNGAKAKIVSFTREGSPNEIMHPNDTHWVEIVDTNGLTDKLGNPAGGACDPTFELRARIEAATSTKPADVDGTHVLKQAKLTCTFRGLRVVNAPSGTPDAIHAEKQGKLVLDSATATLVGKSGPDFKCHDPIYVNATVTNLTPHRAQFHVWLGSFALVGTLINQVDPGVTRTADGQAEFNPNGALWLATDPVDGIAAPVSSYAPHLDFSTACALEVAN